MAEWIEATGCEQPEVIYRREPFAGINGSGFTVVIELAFLDPAHASAFKIRWF